LQRQTDTTSSYRIPQGWKAARVGSRSGAMLVCYFYFPSLSHLDFNFFLALFCLMLADYMYIIKVKGKAKIPDYIQLRDEDFVLIAYFRADRPLKKLEKYGLEGKDTELSTLIAKLSYGKLQPLNI
jgi:hypothetical protein